MFGLLQKRTCSTDAVSRNDYRLHYCGTCKTMGAMYGQTTRLFLNFDTVFFAELLSALDADTASAWSNAYQSSNCFALPKTTAEQPFALRYAATANVFLAELKLNDNITDKPTLFAKTTRQYLDSNFAKASAQLEAFGVDVAAIHALEAQQVAIESVVKQELTFYATPTVAITEAVFSGAAAHLSGVNSGTNLDAELRAVGRAFGELVYILDAYEDFDKDKNNGEFNALSAHFSVKQLSAKHRLAAIKAIRDAEQKMATALTKLPLATAISEEFVARLSANITLRLAAAAPAPPAPKIPFAQRISNQIAYRTKAAHTAANAAFKGVALPIGTLNYAAYSIVIFFIPQVSSALQHTQKHSSWKLTALWIALLTTFGIGKYAHKTCKNKAKGADCCGGGDPCGDCKGGDCSGGDGCVSCCTGCGCACGSAICEGMTSTCCERLCQSNRGDGSGVALVITLLCILALLAVVAYVLLHK